MRRAHARQAARNDLAALGDELSEQPVVLVVDVFDLFDAELANLLAPEELASPGSAFAGRSTRSASATAKSGTISAGSSAFTTRRPLAGCRLLWCFRFVCHNWCSPSDSLPPAKRGQGSGVRGQQQTCSLHKIQDSDP